MNNACAYMCECVNKCKVHMLVHTCVCVCVCVCVCLCVLASVAFSEHDCWAFTRSLATAVVMIPKGPFTKAPVTVSSTEKMEGEVG